MKRAWLILITALAVLLVYPATAPFAKRSSDSHDTFDKRIITSKPDRPIGDNLDPNGEGDSGDADDTAGLKDPKSPDGGFREVGFRAGVTKYAEAWWMYFLGFFRIY